jgi:hypothetical protein
MQRVNVEIHASQLHVYKIPYKYRHTSKSGAFATREAGPPAKCSVALASTSRDRAHLTRPDTSP